MPILSYIGAVRYLFHAPDILEEGYAKVSCPHALRH